jgi:hypothetical protein
MLKFMFRRWKTGVADEILKNISNVRVRLVMIVIRGLFTVLTTMIAVFEGGNIVAFVLSATCEMCNRREVACSDAPA